MEEAEMDRDFGDFFQRDFSDFSEDGGGGGGGPGAMGGGPPFRGRGGGGPWRGRGGGRGHFDNGFGPRGPPPRFRGGRGGFMGPNMRGGPGPRGPPGYRGGGGHFERPFRPQGGGWNNNGPPHHMQHGHGGGPEQMGGGSANNDSQDQIWAEAKTDTGTVYYYNTKTRVTSWEKPEGPNITVMSHEEWSASMMKNKSEGSRFGGAEENQSPGFGSQSPPSSQGSTGGFSRPQSAGSTGSTSFQCPTQTAQTRPPMHMGPGGGGPNQFNSQFRHPGPEGFSPGGENGLAPDGDKEAALGPHKGPGGPRPLMNSIPVGQQPPGFPPFGPMTTPPPFGMPFPGNFAMVPPPWNPMAGGVGVPPPTGVPPPLIASVDPIVQSIDPQIVARAFEWSEHTAPDGKSYYFNAKTQASVWEKPPPLIDFETAKVLAQQRLMQQAMLAAKEKASDKHHDSTAEQSKTKDSESKKITGNVSEKCRPVSSTPVTGTPWCVVWTGDKRVFFYNPSTKSSVWERPPDLIGRLDVEELLKNTPSGKAAHALPLASVKKVEATSTTEPPPGTALALANLNSTIQSQMTNSLSFNVSSMNSISANGTTDKSEPPARPDAKIVINIDKRSREPDESVGDPPEKKAKTQSDSEEVGDKTEVITIEDEGKPEEEKKEPFKEANALEAEVKAARERAIVPLETRLQQFKDMLSEKQVSAFSTWEKELHKIVFDSRYLLLTSKERKAAFDNYVRERALEERREKKTRLAQVKDRFLSFLEDVNVHQKMSYNEFSQKYNRDERFKAVEKTRDRELYFTEFIADLKKKEKEAKSHKKDKVKEDFNTLLKEKVRDYHVKWPDIRKKLDDSRFDALEGQEKEDLFRMFQKKLKVEMKYKERKRKKKMKKEKREREKVAKSKSSDDKIEKEPEEEGEASDDNDNEKSNDDGDGELETEGDATVESDKMEDISDEEEEEGVISDDTDDEDRIRKEKAEVSLREREKEVQRALATHLRDRDKERDFYRHEEAVQEFQAMLTDLVRSSDMSWRDAKKNAKKDRRWESVSLLSREEMEEYFVKHLESIAKKKKLRFRDVLQEARVKLNSTWRDIRKKIRDDPRFQKYASDERNCEREFAAYLKDLATTMKSEFRSLLKETKMLNYKTKQHIRENPQIIRDIEALLEKDKRFLNLESIPDERHRLLVDYLDDLERKGPPPPPTASDKQIRRLK